MNTIAYTAGYLDGDGCFYTGQWIDTKGMIYYDTKIEVVSVKKESLDFFKENFGGSIMEKPYRRHHRTSYVWKISGKKSAKLGIKLIPFLTDKKIQCMQFVSMQATIVPNCGKAITDEIHAIRRNIMEEMRHDKHMNYFVTKEIVERLQDVDTIAPQQHDWPYFAGLIDSEGCFRIKKWKPKNKPNYVYAIALEIGNTRYPMLEFLMERFGGNIVYIPAKGDKRASATWSISSFALSQIIPNIVPHLIIKKAAAEKLIEFYNTTLPNGGDRHSEEFKKLYAEKLIDRERIVDEIHKLNLKGLKV